MENKEKILIDVLVELYCFYVGKVLIPKLEEVLEREKKGGENNE